MGLELHLGLGLVPRVLERAHDVRIDRTTLRVDEPLLAPSEAVAHQAVGDADAPGVLLVEGDDQGEGVADPDVLGDLAHAGIAGEDAHRAAGHRGEGGHRVGRLEAEKRGEMVTLIRSALL